METLTKPFLGHRFYSVGYGREGRIPHAICVTQEELESTVQELNLRQQANVYIRPNVNFYSIEPARIRDIDIIRPAIYILDIDEKDNPNVNIEAKLVVFITAQNLTNHLLQYTGHGCQLWLRCDPVETVEQFRSNARRLKGWIEAETDLVVDFTPNPSRYGRFPGTINWNPPVRQGRVISWEQGEPFDINKCPQLATNHHEGRVHCGDKPTTPPPPFSTHPHEEAALGITGLTFIRSHVQRRKVLAVLQDSRATHNSRLWLVGFLRYCGLSRYRIRCVIHRYNKWSDYTQRITRSQVKSIWRCAGRRAGR